MKPRNLMPPVMVALLCSTAYASDGGWSAALCVLTAALWGGLGVTYLWLDESKKQLAQINAELERCKRLSQYSERRTSGDG